MPVALPLAGAAIGGLAGGSLGAAGLGLGLGSTVGGLFGGGGGQRSAPATFSQGGNPAAYVPMAQPQADVQYQNLLNQMIQAGQQNLGTYLPQTIGAGQQAYNTAQYLAQNIAPTLSAMGNQNALQLMGLTPGLIAAGQAGYNQLQPLAGQLINMGFDPQQQLYNQLLNRTQQQAAAANAMAGVSGPYAANVADQATRDFNIQWQNQQLQRAVQGATGGEQALGQALGQLGTGAQFGQQAATGGLNLGYQAAQDYMNANLAPLQALNQLYQDTQQAFVMPQQALNDLQSYLRLGQSASDLATRLGATGFEQGQTQLGNIGGLLGAGSNLLFGSQGPFGSGGLIGPLTGSGGLFGSGVAGGASGMGNFGTDPGLFGAGPTAADLAWMGPADVSGLAAMGF